MILFLFLFYFILTIYVLFIGAFIYGFDKMKLKKFAHANPKTSFSIVVPFRNEAENLPKLLETLSLLDYPKELFEVILVDDQSTDFYEVSDSWFQLSVIDNIRKTSSPKKDAINTAIAVAKNNWIITTDADCLVQSNWLKVIDNYIQSENKKMVAAGVSYLPKNGFLYAFQHLDFLSLQGVTIGSFGINKPFMCNGANFAYEKAFFNELNGFNGNSNVVSGDDVFLLQKAIAYDSKSVGFCTHYHSFVKTKSVATWKELFFQRVRWASKSSAYVDWFSKTLAIVVFLANLFLVMGYGLWAMGFVSYGNLLFYFGIKFLVDFIIIQKSALFFRQQIRYVLICSIIYPFFTSVVALYSLFGKYTWKDRRFRK